LAVDLLGAYRLALSSDPTIEGERQDLLASLEKVPEARSALLPSIGASAQLGRTGGPVTYTNTPTVSRTFSTVSWTAQLGIPLLRMQNIDAYRQSNRLADQARAQFALAEQKLILRVAKAYFDALVAQEAYVAASAQVQAAEEQRAVAKRSYETGVGSVTDVDEATSKAELARYQSIAASTDVDNRRAELEQITGPLGDDRLAQLKSNAHVLPPEPAELNQWLDQARENNTTVIGLRAAIEAAELEVDKARAQRLPTVDLVGSYGRNFSSGDNINPIDYATNAKTKQGMLQFSLPIVDGGAIQAQIREARAKQAKSESDLEAARRQAVVDARAAYQGVVGGLAQIQALDAALDSSIRSIAGNVAGYRVGLRINSDVLNSQQQRYAAQRDLAKARYDTLLQGLKLKAAAGVLQSSDLVPLNDLFIAAPLQ
jgi:outer membrane protein